MVTTLLVAGLVLVGALVVHQEYGAAFNSATRLRAKQVARDTHRMRGVTALKAQCSWAADADRRLSRLYREAMAKEYPELWACSGPSEPSPRTAQPGSSVAQLCRPSVLTAAASTPTRHQPHGAAAVIQLQSRPRVRVFLGARDV